MAKSPEEMAASMIENLKEKTGKDLSEWMNLLRLNERLQTWGNS